MKEKSFSVEFLRVSYTRVCVRVGVCVCVWHKQRVYFSEYSHLKNIPFVIVYMPFLEALLQIIFRMYF